jgi:hypothetical protein
MTTKKIFLSKIERLPDDVSIKMSVFGVDYDIKGYYYSAKHNEFVMCDKTSFDLEIIKMKQIG